MLLCNTVWRRPLISEAGVVGEPVLCQCRSHCVGIDTIASLGQEETQIKRTIIGLFSSRAINTRQNKKDATYWQTSVSGTYNAKD